MAQQVEIIIRLTDDIDGSVGDETIEFGWDGKEYVIDLSGDNADALREAIAPFLNAARIKTKTTTTKAAKSVSGSKSADRHIRDEMREWGRRNGFKVAQFSRVPRAVVDAYHAAHLAPAPVHSTTNGSSNGSSNGAVSPAAAIEEAPARRRGRPRKVGT